MWHCSLCYLCMLSRCSMQFPHLSINSLTPRTGNKENDYLISLLSWKFIQSTLQILPIYVILGLFKSMPSRKYVLVVVLQHISMLLYTPWSRTKNIGGKYSGSRVWERSGASSTLLLFHILNASDKVYDTYGERHPRAHHHVHGTDSEKHYVVDPGSRLNGLLDPW